MVRRALTICSNPVPMNDSTSFATRDLPNELKANLLALLEVRLAATAAKGMRDLAEYEVSLSTVELQ